MDQDRYIYEIERPLVDFVDAVETVAAFIGGDEGGRIKSALLSLGHVPETVPPEQASLPFSYDSISLPF